MNGEEIRKKWNGMSTDIMRGMVEWQTEHPEATSGEIEAEVNKLLSELRVRMLSDAAMCSEINWRQGGEPSNS